MMKAKKIKMLAAELVTELSSQRFLDKPGLTAQRVREIAGREYWEKIFYIDVLDVIVPI